MKICSKCKIEKDESEFYKRSKNGDLFLLCKSCYNKNKKEYRLRPDVKERDNQWHKEYRLRPDVKEREKQRTKKYYARPDVKVRQKINSLKFFYGLSFDKYINIFNVQGGLCAICLIQLKLDRKTHVDHDHKTNEVRGILCSSCNRLLGIVNDSIPILKLAIRYLEKHENDSYERPASVGEKLEG